VNMPLARINRRLRDFFVNRVLGVHDTPHRIALGVAVGIFVTWMPVIGFQMILIVAFSILLRANKVVGVPFAWITNPATLWIYIPNYFLGCWLLGSAYEPGKLMHGLMCAFGPSERDLWGRLDGILETLRAVAVPLFLGSAIVGAVLGAITYFLVRRAVIQYRRFRHEDVMTGYSLERKDAPASDAEPAPTDARV